MLEEFRKAKQTEIAALLARGIPKPYAGAKPDFAAALKKDGSIAVVAEYKRASPSRGAIRTDLPVETVAAMYQANGAAAMSILTEGDFFQGHLSFLDRAAAGASLPLLRKDFLFEACQIKATAATRASALLLIARMLPGAEKLAELLRLAESYGLSAVVEVFDLADLRLAREAGAGIIQVNARDLDTLKVSRQACLDIIKEGKPAAGEIWIAASGISEPDQLEQARQAGFDAALVGSSLMEKANPGAALAALLGRTAARN